MIVTAEGKRTLEDMMPTIKDNRAVALRGITEEEIAQLQYLLEKIFNNCTNQICHEEQLPNQSTILLPMDTGLDNAIGKPVESAEPARTIYNGESQ
ncbi:hypothetical protein GCM10027291_19190 [Telluribacter humicola]